MPLPRGDQRPALTPHQLWRRTLFTIINVPLIFLVIQIVFRIEALPLPVRLVLLVVASLPVTALVSWWFYRTGDEHDREYVMREWAWVRRLWRRARLGRS